ncbi:glycosyltransferase [Listeria weihenstephanensis]|uniref:Glycosyltransferase n=1 Tax=Listeria weihenstephanensis TaxID=1006155 RepID=A0A841Z3V1_9LIST|nr:glycosyltransferase [Listeria weihenstephanensis]MBC1499127.1 glycosyltransferase [Listeria weihenstephanensis]
MKKQLKVLAIGAGWRGSNSRSLFSGFTKLGCDIRVIETDGYFYNYTIPERLYMKVRKLPFKAKFQKFNKTIERTIDSYQPDILFVVKGLWVTEEIIQYAKSKGITTIHFHPDFLFDDRYHTSQILDKAILAYDIVVTAKTTEVEKYKQFGCQYVHFMKYAYDPDIHHPIKLTNQEIPIFKTDVAFVGRMELPRADALNEIAEANYDLKVWGTKWDKIPKSYKLNRFCEGRPIFCEEMAKVFQGAKVSVGFLTTLSTEQHTARTFEIPACGGFFLGTRTAEHMDIFKQGVEADFFSSKEELVEKVAFYTRNEDMRSKIAQKGYDKVIQMDATYESRVKEILVFSEIELSNGVLLR